MGDEKNIGKQILTKCEENEPTRRANHLAPGRGDGDFSSANEGQHSLPSSRAELGSQMPEPDSSHRPRDYGHSATQEQRAQQSYRKPRDEGHPTNHDVQRVRFSSHLGAREQENSANVNVGFKQKDYTHLPGSQNPWRQDSSSNQSITWRDRREGGPSFTHEIHIPVGRNESVDSSHELHSHALQSNPDVPPNTLNHLDRSKGPLPYPTVDNQTCGNNSSRNFNRALQNQGIYFFPSILNSNSSININHHHVYRGQNVIPSSLQPTYGGPYQVMVDPILAQYYSNPTYFQYGNMPLSYYTNPRVMTSNYLNYFATLQARQPFYIPQLAETPHAVPVNNRQQFFAPQGSANHANRTCSCEPLYYEMVREAPGCFNHLSGDGNNTSQSSGVYGQPFFPFSYSPPNCGASHLKSFTNSASNPQQQGSTNGVIPGEMSSMNQTQGPQSTSLAAEVPVDGNQTLSENIPKGGEKMEKKKKQSEVIFKESKRLCNRKYDEEDGNGNSCKNARLG